MSMDTTLRPTTSTSSTGSTISTATPARLAPARATGNTDTASNAAASGASASTPLRGKSTSVDGGLQSQVARAQQAVDYLGRVAGQLETLKGELTARLTGARNGSQAGSQAGSRQQLDAQVRQLAATLNARKQDAGGSVDANLQYTRQPAVQRFRIRGLDLAGLQQDAPQSLAFSVGGAGGPQLAVTIQPDQSSGEIAGALDRALAPMGVHAGLDDQGALVFSTPESNWPAVKDSIAVSGRGKVTTDEVPASPAPQHWNVSDGSGATDSLRQSLREVVQALERVRHSQDAASTALSAATLQVSESQTPPPEVGLAAQDFASVAASTDYDSLLALSSALVGVSRDRVLALLGLR
jgi:hypothetical protein